MITETLTPEIELTEVEKAQAILKEAEQKKVAENAEILNEAIRKIEANGCEIKVMQVTYGGAVVKEEIQIVVKK